jgi:hypothetical protein
LPEEWKKSIIVPLYKKGDKTDCSNYRGISLLPTTYKVFSNILLSRLTAYAEEINGDHQHGFRRNKSTADHMFLLRQILKKNEKITKQCISSLYTSRKLMIQLGGRSCIIFIKFGLHIKLARLKNSA